MVLSFLFKEVEGREVSIRELTSGFVSTWSCSGVAGRSMMVKHGL